MRIQNTTLADIRLNYRTGQTVVVPSGQYVIRPAGDTDYLDDTAVTLSLFSSGALVLYNDDGSAYSGTPLPSAPSAPPATFPVMVTTSSDGEIGFSVGVPIISRFPGFSPSILASFVAGTTATQSGTTATVTATAHGIVGSTARNGWRIYWPGSPSIAAGWYQGFAWVDANTITFTNPTSQTVASESMNGGAAFVSQVTLSTLTLPGGSMGPNGRITVRYIRSGDNTAGNKVSRLLFAGSTMASNGGTTSGNITAQMTIVNRSVSQQSATNSYDSSGSSSFTASTWDSSVDRSVAFTMQVSNASQWLAIDYLELEVVNK